MIVRTLVAAAVITGFACPQADAQLFKKRRESRQQSTVVHVHSAPVHYVEPIIYRQPTIVTPVINQVVYTPEYQAPLTPIASAATTTVFTSTAPTVTVNKLPLRTPAFVPAEDDTEHQLRIVNPKENAGSIRYQLNDIAYEMKPGESQTIGLDRDWVIKFDNGLEQQVMYRLNAGSYEFTVNADDGWNLIKRKLAVAKSNTIPANRLPTQTVSKDLTSLSVPPTM